MCFFLAKTYITYNCVLLQYPNDLQNDFAFFHALSQLYDYLFTGTHNITINLIIYYVIHGYD